VSDSSAGITEEMIEAFRSTLFVATGKRVPKFAVMQAFEAALAGRTVPEPEIDWPTVEAAVHRAVTHYARAYWIPANFLCGGIPEAMQRMAENWAKISAPFITACIQEDLRKAAAVSSKGGDPRG